MSDRACLLDYSLHTDPFPLSASPAEGDHLIGRLLLVVSNGGSESIRCKKIRLHLMIGELAQNPTDVGKGIQPFVTPSDKWEVVYDEDGHFTVTPRRPNDREMSVEGMTICIDNLYVNPQPGTFQVRLTEVARFPEEGYEDRHATLRAAKYPHFLMKRE